MEEQEPSVWEQVWPLCNFEMALLELEIARLDESELVRQMKDAFIKSDPGYGAFRIYVRRHGSAKLCKALKIPHNPPS